MPDPGGVSFDMRHMVLIASALVTAACAGRVLPPAGNTAYGVYGFKQVVNSTPSVVLEGAVLLLPDSVSLSLKSGPCYYRPNNRSAVRSFTYYCGDYTFSFDRQNPLRENSFSVPSVRYVSKRICLVTNPITNACTKWGTEREEQRFVMYGRLSLAAQ